MGSNLSKADIAGIVIGVIAFVLVSYPCGVWLLKLIAHRRDERNYRDFDDWEDMMFVGDEIRKSFGMPLRWRPASLRSNASMWIGRNRKVELFGGSRKKPDWLQHPIQMDDLERGSLEHSDLRLPENAHLREVDSMNNDPNNAQPSMPSQEVVVSWPMPPNSSTESAALGPTHPNKPVSLTPAGGVRLNHHMSQSTSENTNEHIPHRATIRERRRHFPPLTILIPPPSSATSIETPKDDANSDHSDPVPEVPAVPPPLPPRVNPWRSLPSPPPTRTWVMRRLLAEQTEEIRTDSNSLQAMNSLTWDDEINKWILSKPHHREVSDNESWETIDLQAKSSKEKKARSFGKKTGGARRQRF